MTRSSQRIQWTCVRALLVWCAAPGRPRACVGERKRQKHARDVHGRAGNVEHISASAWCRAQLRLRRTRPDVGRACPHTSVRSRPSLKTSAARETERRARGRGRA